MNCWRKEKSVLQLENDLWEGAFRSPGLVENFAHRIRLWHRECTGSIQTAKELVTIQFMFIAIWQKVQNLLYNSYGSCNMGSYYNLRFNLLWLGATSILHDSELPTDVGHCADPGCYSRAVRYRNATMRQMIALADLSSECHQTIQVKINWYIGISTVITESISFFPFLLLVRLQFRTVRFERRHLFLVERQERSSPEFLVGEQRKRPHLSVRNRPQLHRILCDLQLRLGRTRSTNRCR